MNINLENLSLQEIDELQNALSTLKKHMGGEAKKENSSTKKSPTKKKRGRPPKKTSTSTTKKRGRPPKKKPDNQSATPQRKLIRQKRTRRLKKNEGHPQLRDEKGVPCGFEPIQTKNRPNLFLGSAFENMHRKDVSIDKKLNKTNQVSTRRPKVEKVDVECSRCGKIFTTWETNLQFIGGEVIAYCEKCSNR